MVLPVRRFLGNVPVERALQRETKRHGVYIPKSTTTVREIIPRELKEDLATVILNAESGKIAPGYSPEKIETARRMQHLIEIIETHPFVSSVYHLAQAIAFEKGLEKEKLLPWLNAANTLNNRLKAHGQLAFQGTIANLLKAVKLDLPFRLEQYLETTHESLSINELMKRFETPFHPINSALQLLDSMDLIKKLPPKSEGVGGQSYFWVHSQNYRKASGTLPDNLGLRLLRSLTDGPKKFSQFKGIAIDRNLVSTLDKLVEGGLITSKMTKGEIRTSPEYTLTPAAVDLLRAQERIQYLHPELRVRLLGEKRLGLNSAEKRTLERTLNFIGIQLEYAELPKAADGRIAFGLREKLAEKYGFNARKIKHILAFDSFPLGGYSIQKIRGIYLPAIKMIDPASADWLEKFITRHPEKFPVATSKRLERVGKLAGARLQNLPVPEKRKTLVQELDEFASKLLEEGESDKKASKKTRLPLKSIVRIRQRRIDEFKRQMQRGKYGTKSNAKNVAIREEPKIEIKENPEERRKEIFGEISHWQRSIPIIEKSDAKPELKERLLRRVQEKLERLNLELQSMK